MAGKPPFSGRRPGAQARASRFRERHRTLHHLRCGHLGCRMPLITGVWRKRSFRAPSGWLCAMPRQRCEDARCISCWRPPWLPPARFRQLSRQLDRCGSAAVEAPLPLGGAGCGARTATRRRRPSVRTERRRVIGGFAAEDMGASSFNGSPFRPPDQLLKALRSVLSNPYNVALLVSDLPSTTHLR